MNIVSEFAILRQKSRELSVEEIRARAGTVRDMEATLEESGGIGLAAIQVAVPERFFIVNHPFVDACFNPEVLDASSETEEAPEGCLSLAGGKERYLVSRPAAIRVRYRNARGKTVTRSLTELGARVFQHELDHLDGTLICDRGVRAPELD